MNWMASFAGQFWRLKRYWLVPLILLVLLLIGLAMTGDPMPQRSFKYATF